MCGGGRGLLTHSEARMRSSMAGVMLAGGMVGTGGGVLRRIRECQDRAQGRGLSARGRAQAQSRCATTETASVGLDFLAPAAAWRQPPTLNLHPRGKIHLPGVFLRGCREACAHRPISRERKWAHTHHDCVGVGITRQSPSPSPSTGHNFQEARRIHCSAALGVLPRNIADFTCCALGV
jgi:hypothetical protein